MKIFSVVTIAIGIGVLLCFFFLQFLLLAFTPKNDIGDGHYVIFFPPQADPVTRLFGVLAGALIALAGCTSWFLTDKRRKTSRKPVVRLITNAILLIGIGAWAGVQTAAAQQPDYVRQAYFSLRQRHIEDGVGMAGAGGCGTLSRTTRKGDA